MAVNAPPSPPSSTPAPAADSPKPQDGRLILGYYVPYDPSSWSTVEAQADHLDFVAAQWVTVDACGGIGSRDDRTLNTLVRARGGQVLPSLLTADQTLIHRLLREDSLREQTVANIVSYLKEEGYPGFDLDIENIAADDRAAYTTFVARLSDALHGQGKLLVAALPAKRSEATTGWGGAYDYAALAPSLDYALIMAYAYTTADSLPGSTAPLAWVDQVASFAASQIPPAKVLLGLAFYGYDWNLTAGGRAKALRYEQAAALAQRYGVPIRSDPASRSATFSYTATAADLQLETAPTPALAHEIVERKPPPCALTPPTPTPAPPRPTVPPSPTATPPPLQQHVVWLEDADSIAARLALADRRGIAGIGAWRLGQEDPAVWPLLDAWRRAR